MVRRVEPSKDRPLLSAFSVGARKLPTLRPIFVVPGAHSPFPSLQRISLALPWSGEFTLWLSGEGMRVG